MQGNPSLAQVSRGAHVTSFEHSGPRSARRTSSDTPGCGQSVRAGLLDGVQAKLARVASAMTGLATLVFLKPSRKYSINARVAMFL